MLWNSLVCLDHWSVKTLSLEVQGSNPNSENFYFLKILMQIKNKISKF